MPRLRPQHFVPVLSFCHHYRCYHWFLYVNRCTFGTHMLANRYRALKGFLTFHIQHPRLKQVKPVARDTCFPPCLSLFLCALSAGLCATTTECSTESSSCDEHEPSREGLKGGLGDTRLCSCLACVASRELWISRSWLELLCSRI